MNDQAAINSIDNLDKSNKKITSEEYHSQEILDGNVLPTGENTYIGTYLRVHTNSSDVEKGFAYRGQLFALGTTVKEREKFIVEPSSDGNSFQLKSVFTNEYVGIGGLNCLLGNGGLFALPEACKDGPEWFSVVNPS